jgi:hypothetical protein
MARRTERDGSEEIEQTRAALLDLLISKVRDDRFPSTTTLDLLESILTVEELPAYASVLMEKVAEENYPSPSMMKRLVSLTSMR